MNCAIDTIQIQSFRGVRHINLALGGRSLILVGENGSGKSSLVDAIEFFFTGRVAPLEGRSDVDKGQSIRNLQGGSPKVTLALRGVLPESGISLPYPNRDAAVPPALAPLCSLASRRSFVLRRTQILKFVNARGTERYETISQLIGLGELDRIDESWRSERNLVQARVAKLCQDRQAIHRRLGQLLGLDVQGEQDIIQAVNVQLAGYALLPIARREDLADRKRTVEQRTRLGLDVTRAERLKTLLGELDQIERMVELASARYERVERAIQEHWELSQVQKDASLERLLREGHTILIEQPEWEVCPLCAEPLRDKVILIRDLQDRLNDLQGLADSHHRVSELQAGLQNILSGLRFSLDSLHRGLTSQGMHSYARVVEGAHAEIEGQERGLDRLERTLSAKREWHENRGVADLRDALPQIKHSLAEQVELVAPSETERTLLDWLFTMTRVDEQWHMLQQITAELGKAEYVSRQVNLVYDELLAARRRGLESLREELEGEFDHLYQQLHPDEGYEGITIPVHQDQRSSVALQSTFHQQGGMHPIGYFSEGHLDSLGLCIFLAFIKRFNPDLKLIVLDDVLTTVDAGHRLRVARLLAREFSHYQLVITTHDQLWANELRSAIQNAKVIQLRRWTLEHGVDYHDNVLSDWEYYAQQAEAGRPQDTIGGAGRSLEKFLYQMRRNLGLAVPATQDGTYAIGDLYEPFWKWVKRYQPERPDRPDFARELEDLNQELDEVWRLRNWSGAHFNAWAETVTAEEALAFLHAIERLVTAFECPVCHNLVVYTSPARALTCPRCQPCPPPHMICEYKPGWWTAVPRILGAPAPKARQHAVRLTQSVCHAFLRDMRRKLQLHVPATPDDQYDLSELYVPFFEWSAIHPRAGVPGWPDTLAGRKYALDEFWHDGRWAEVPDAEIEPFVDAVRQITALFECDTCSQLLSYDYDSASYFCATCSRQETMGSLVPAYWSVRKD